MKTRRFFPLPVVLAATCVAVAPTRAQSDSSTQDLRALHKVARFQTLASKNKNYTAKVVFPVFRARMPLARYANAQIRAEVVKPYREWVKNTKKDLATESTSLPYEYQTTPDPAFFIAPHLISTRLNAYEFTGGAHGMSVMIPLNFGIVGGKPKTLHLGDFFRPGTPYRKRVETQIFAKLRKHPGTDWVHDGSVKTLETAQFNNFSVERDGLRWLFDQYEMGSYASGQFEAKLSLQELGPGFRRELLR